MNKFILAIFAMLVSFNASAFSLEDLNIFAKGGDENAQTKTITMPTAEELKAQAAANSITSYFDNNDVMNISPEQKQMLKSSYDYIKAQDITNPQVKQITDKAIKLIDDSGIFNDSDNVLDNIFN